MLFYHKNITTYFSGFIFSNRNDGIKRAVFRSKARFTDTNCSQEFRVTGEIIVSTYYKYILF